MQTQQEQRLADARLCAFDGKAGFLFGSVTTLLGITWIGVLIIGVFILTLYQGQTTASIDFRVFWSAGQLALSGEPFAAFDTARLEEIHGHPSDFKLPWLYPPGFLAFVTPFGALPFATAFMTWNLISLGLSSWAIWPFTAGKIPLWFAACLAPAFYKVLLLGQNSLFLMALLLAALSALRSERWILAGVFVGLMTLKPQLGIMIPFALLAMRAWTTIFSAISTTALLIILPTWLYGMEYWPLLQVQMADHATKMIDFIPEMRWMISLIAFMTWLGIDPELALKLQFGIAAACAVAVYMLWRSPRVCFDIKAAGLLLSIMISAPYLWSYEAVLMVPVALFLLRGGVLTTRPLHLPLLAALWLGAGMLTLNIFLGLVDPRWLGVAFLAPVLLSCFALCLRELKHTGIDGHGAM